MTAPADYYAEQAAADAELAGADDWPDADVRRYMLRRGRWKPVDVLDDISNYQPQEAA